MSNQVNIDPKVFSNLKGAIKRTGKSADEIIQKGLLALHEEETYNSPSMKMRCFGIKLEQLMDYQKWSKEIPCISFPSHWNVRIIPAYAGAVIRFLVFHEQATVSIYLDCYSLLGSMDRPYWEIYPNCKNDNERFFIEEVENLIYAIELSLAAQNKTLEMEKS